MLFCQSDPPLRGGGGIARVGELQGGAPLLSLDLHCLFCWRTRLSWRLNSSLLQGRTALHSNAWRVTQVHRQQPCNTLTHRHTHATKET